MSTGHTQLEIPPSGPHGQAAPPTRAPRKRRSILELLILPRVQVAVTVLLDVLAASVSVAIARYWEAATTVAPYHGVAVLPWLFVPILIALLAGRGMYRPQLLRNFLDELHPVEASVALAACGLLVPMLVFTENYMVGEFVLRCWLCAAVLVPAVRLIRAVLQRYLRRRFRSAAPTLVIGDGPISHQLMDHLQQLPEYGMRPIGLLDDPGAGSGDHLPELLRVDVPRLGTPADLADVVRATAATNLVVSFCPLPDSELIAVVRTAQRLGMRVWVVPRLFDAVGARARVEHVGGLPLMALPDIDPRGWQFTVKHTMDRTVAAVALLAISPVFLTLALLVRLSSPGPIFFRQRRVGRDGRSFDCLKFRSMRPPRPSDEQFELRAGSAPGGVEGVDRRTRIGKFMRQTSLDELPQLVNVLRGEMSLVGPRPERPEFVELFEMQIRRYGERHRVKAGVTGWAQVHGLRGQTSIASRAEWDNYYIENWSLWLDVKILALTVLAVLRRSED
ncbi:undecaprenyl-phosphate glucose phosphotransferase [Mycolicibacterium litorale]|uniref:Undecaprenyl-phosphate glucose phosphotransferase n=1 Tax=Mycolicibacterium litorale TaxID=758802 RepID=A0A6S6P3I3_9MYCO|nr:sugar transferase [Mycolicibacterium litorale]BCI54403.1 undecaprenyl-phosphate glucose phosphotransferase [Mycolicibacterium litorale]